MSCCRTNNFACLTLVSHYEVDILSGCQNWGIQYHLCSTYRGLWGLVVVWLSWLSGRALVVQARGVLCSTPGNCRPLHYLRLRASKCCFSGSELELVGISEVKVRVHVWRCISFFSGVHSRHKAFRHSGPNHKSKGPQKTSTPFTKTSATFQ